MGWFLLFFASVYYIAWAILQWTRLVVILTIWITRGLINVTRKVIRHGSSRR